MARLAARLVVSYTGSSSLNCPMAERLSSSNSSELDTLSQSLSSASSTSRSTPLSNSSNTIFRSLVTIGTSPKRRFSRPSSTAAILAGENRTDLCLPHFADAGNLLMHDFADSSWRPANFDFVVFRPPLANIAFRKAASRARGEAGVRRFRRSRIRLLIEPCLFLSGGGSEQKRSHRVRAGQGRAVESASEEEKPPKLEQSEELEVEKWRRRFAGG
ncbi:hypothetical protein M5K25_020613 [Dendrobium thyrsiflorum]|uniref:Uncharacterized protein n=1 Tax=Dendrobium thyrsiflorum TaxID=117978 RepID=A0ABD0UB21_DENTH